MMKMTMIALGAGAGCLLFAGSAIAGPCSDQIAMLSPTVSHTDAGMGATGENAMQQSAGNPVSPSGAPQVPTTPATGAMNEASQNKATSQQDVQQQNTGQGTTADTATGAAPSSATGSSAAAASLQRAQQLDQAGNEAACMEEIGKARQAIGLQ
jgi:hypothetical protein